MNTSKLSPPAHRQEEISARLREARLTLGFSIQEFAFALGVAVNTIGRCELRQTYLRFDLALKICRRFIISELWLAKGEGHMRHYLDLSEFVPDMTPPVNTRFSVVFDNYLDREYRKLAQLFPDSIRFKLHHDDTPAYCRDVLNFLADHWVEKLKALPNSTDAEIIGMLCHCIKTLDDRAACVHQRLSAKIQA
ncbi:MAG TPA: helix-turn-helix transcriptional regulator [Pyrinomonadaceae bacterium]|nr:helix-turn-helix transcriptional regulator [Pyrinomonadaceae bacterium]